jgi:hypothetical protein
MKLSGSAALPMSWRTENREPATRASSDSIVVTIPIKNEASHIGACLLALARQRDVQATQIQLLLNNCVDGTINVIQDVAPALDVPVDVLICDFPAELRSAGYARHVAMEHAAATMTGGILLTTDADGCVTPDWIANNLHAIRTGADAVAGRTVIDSIDAMRLPERLHCDDALECMYSDLLDEIAALLDPDPWDPWPRHSEHSGASIAVTWDAYRRAGGMPSPPLGEDREFFRALRRIDARIRHAADVRVTVSGRILGRAIGGMADTMRRRLERPDPWFDGRLEPPDDAVRRAQLRRALRGLWATETVEAAPLSRVAVALGVSADWLCASLSHRFFGRVWERIEAVSPALIRRRVAATSAGEAIARATVIRDLLVGDARISRPELTDRAGIAASPAAAAA